MEKETGGTAFPRPGANWMDQENRAMGCDAQLGMSLRDYFAAKAMQGDISSMQAHEDPASAAHHIAARAYAVADAMLKERNK